MTPDIDIYLDFETFYDEKAGYSLRKMPTAQYVRDGRFRVEGVSISIPALNVRQWVEDPTALFDALPWHRVRVFAHNNQFDALILTEHYGHTPAKYACTMFMARYAISQGFIDPRLGTSLHDLAPLVGMEKWDMDAAIAAGTLDTYAMNDLDILEALAALLLPMVPATEQGFIDQHVRMAVEPKFQIATSELQAIADKDKALEGLFPLVRKDATFIGALEGFGVAMEYKTTAKGNVKPALAKTDKFMQRLLDHDDDRVRTLAETRISARSTIHRTRAQRFLDVGSPLPAPVLYAGAHTGRGSGLDKLNVQNLPRKGGLRQCITAPRFHKLVIVDSSQVEVRVNAWLSGQHDLLDAFRLGQDPYLLFASKLYNTPLDDLTARYAAEGDDGGPAHDMRQVAKAAVLALGFMQGAGGFLGYCETFGVPMDAATAQRTVDVYRAAHPCIVQHANQCMAEIKQTHALQLPSGRHLTYPDFRMVGRDCEYRRARIFAKSVNEGWSSLWRGTAIENKVQAVARDAVFEQQLRLTEQGYHVALMVHDESVLVVPEERAERARYDAEREFARPPAWAPDLPMAGEARITDHYVK